MKYCILQSDDAVQLQFHVQEALRNGWEPQGGVAVTSWTTGPDARDPYELRLLFVQALVKSDEKP